MVNEVGGRQRKVNENSLKNLEAHKWKPGQSGNPSGGPKKVDSLVMCIKDELEALSENGVTTNARIIAMMLVSAAKKGSLKAAEMCADYVSGKPNQSITGKDGSPLPALLKVYLGGNDAIQE